MDLRNIGLANTLGTPHLLKPVCEKMLHSSSSDSSSIPTSCNPHLLGEVLLQVLDLCEDFFQLNFPRGRRMLRMI